MGNSSATDSQENCKSVAVEELYFDQVEKRLFEVSSNETLGRHLIAREDISAGDVILNEQPLIKGPSQITAPVCLTCYEYIDPDNHLQCIKCGWPLCRNIQCHNSTTHDPECKWICDKRKQKIEIRHFTNPHRSYECITPIRCLYQKETDPVLWEKLSSLQSHCEERKNTNKYNEDRFAVAQFLYRFFKIDENEFPEEEILKICGIIQVNGHEIPLSEPPHVAIYEYASMLEHSCYPNCCKSFNSNGNILIRATKKICKGEHISICYTDPLWNTINRKHHLLHTKFFTCDCIRCADLTEFGTYYSSFKCINETCNGYLIPYTDKNLNSPEWKCTNSCNIDPESVNEIFRNIVEDFKTVNKHDVESCSRFLDLYENNKLLHDNHYILTDIRLTLAQLYGQTTNIQYISDQHLMNKLNLCHQVLSLVDTLFPAEWRIRGVLMFEIHATMGEKARRDTESRKISPEVLTVTLQMSKKWLEESMHLLKYEPDVLPEGKIAKQAKKNLEDLDMLLQRMQNSSNNDLLYL